LQVFLQKKILKIFV